MSRNDKYFFGTSGRAKRLKDCVLKSLYIRQDLGSCNGDRFIAGGFDLQGIFRIGLFLCVRSQAVLQGGAASSMVSVWPEASVDSSRNVLSGTPV